MNMLSGIFHAVHGQQPEHVPSPMEQLPQDILVLILQSIDSLRSLRAAVLASSAMYDAFKTSKIETLACVISHSRPRELHDDAVALSVFVHMQHETTTKTAKALLTHNLWHSRKEWPFLPKSLSSPELLHFHWYVEYFTEKLFKASMRHVHQKGWLGSEKFRFRRLSHIETVRIQRALYRLELFSAYSRLEPMDPRQLIRTPYWCKHLPVWEMEEIACVQNLIFYRLAVLDPVIESLIHYMDFTVDPRTRISHLSGSKARTQLLTRNIKSLIMSNDLSILFHVLSGPEKQSTRKIIRDIMREVFQPSGNSVHKARLLHFDAEARSSIPHLMFEGRETEQPCTLRLERLRVTEESSDYSSFGYVRAYRTITLELIKMGHMSRKQSSLYNEMKHHEDRKWGYCLWDKDRMEFWGNEFAGASLKTRSQLRVTSQGSPGWTTSRLN